MTRLSTCSNTTSCQVKAFKCTAVNNEPSRGACTHASVVCTSRVCAGTQPYQAIIEGSRGCICSEKYLSGTKWTNTHPSTVVEFVAQRRSSSRCSHANSGRWSAVVRTGRQGGRLAEFNSHIANGGTTWRIVKVKRRVTTAVPKRKFQRQSRDLGALEQRR